MNKKLFALLSASALVMGTLALGGANVAFAAAASGNLTGTVVTVNVGQEITLPDLTVTDAAAVHVTLANDLFIRIPAGVNAVFDQTVTTPTMTPTGGTFAVNPTVTYLDSKTVHIDIITADMAAGNTLLIHGLKIIGNTAGTGATALTWSVDAVGGAGTYGNADATTQVTVVKDGTHDVLTSVTTVAANDVINASTSYTVNFTLPTGDTIPVDGQIIVTAPVGFTVTNATVGAITGMDGTLGIVNNNGAHTMTLTRTGVTSATAGAKSIVLNVIVNQAAAAAAVNFTVQTGISTGALLATANAANVAVLSVDPITTLSCTSSGSAGAIWLRWTVPTGGAGAYLVKDSLATITGGTFAAATTFAQTWVTGTPGQSNQQLVTALTPNNIYYFNLKTTGTDANLSTVSNTVFCTAPTAYTSTGTSDYTPPTSSITDPTAGQGILSGAAYTIAGTSSDTGGSSVVKVEVSTDGGTNWVTATPIVSSGTGFTWQYVWTPSIGSYTIKSRATDGYGNIETSGAGTAVVVGTASTLPSVSVVVGTTTTTTGGTSTTTTTGATTSTTTGTTSTSMPYVSPVGATQIQADITYLQQRLVILLQQLLAQLLAKVGH